MREAFAGYRKLAVSILLAALALRLFFVLACPLVDGDSAIYESFARNLLRSGTYSHLQTQSNVPLRPTLIRVPGYPLFLAAVFAVAGSGNERAVRIVQAFLDTFTCLLIALIAFEISPGTHPQRRKIALWALFLAALCPFLANYAATILTEVPATFLWTAATLLGLRGLKQEAASRIWLYVGLATGAATLFRPESGILAGIFGMALFLREVLQRRQWRRAMLSSSLMAAGLLLALIPWTVRNAWTLKTFQMLAPTQAQDVGERVPNGYLNWCKTWLWTYHDIESYWWPLEAKDLPTGPLPAGSIDNDAQGEIVLGMLKRHNLDGDNLDPRSDREFGFLASQRRRAHPLRYYVTLPFLRSLAMWFTPRVQTLNVDEELLPVKKAWRTDPFDFSVNLILFAVNFLYVALAIGGGISVLKKTRTVRDFVRDFEFLGFVTLVMIIVIRTGFFAYFSLPEPRYVLETYPNIIVLASFVFSGVQGKNPVSR